MGEQEQTTGPRIPAATQPVRLQGEPLEDIGVAEALLQGDWAPGGRFVKREGEAFTWIGSLRTPEGVRDVVLKKIPARTGLRGFLSAAFKKETKGQRQVDGARMLSLAGFRTSEPIMLVRGIENGVRCDWLALEKIQGVSLINTLAHNALGVREEHALARTAGELVLSLDKNNLFNRDHKLSNIILCPDGELGIVDTVGIYHASCITGPAWMLLAMLMEAKGVGLMPRRSILMRCLKAGDNMDDDEPISEAWGYIARLLDRAGDTTPKVNPISGASSSAS